MQYVQEMNPLDFLICDYNIYYVLGDPWLI